MQDNKDTNQEESISENIPTIPSKDKRITHRGRIDIAHALKLRLSNKLTYSEIGKHFNVSKNAARQAINKYLDILAEIEQYKPLLDIKSELLDYAEIIHLTDSLDKDKRNKASLNNTAYAFSQVFNANRLEKEKSTSNNAVIFKWADGDIWGQTEDKQCSKK